MKAITIITTAGVGAFVTGHGSRDLAMKLTQRTPMRANSGWVIRRKQVPDLIALAESRGYRVFVLDESEVGTDV